MRGGDLGRTREIVPSNNYTEGTEVLLSPIFRKCHFKIATVKDNRKRRKRTWYTSDRDRGTSNAVVTRRLQKLHLAVRHSNCLLGKWTLSSLRVMLMIYSAVTTIATTPVCTPNASLASSGHFTERLSRNQ